MKKIKATWKPVNIINENSVIAQEVPVNVSSVKITQTV